MEFEISIHARQRLRERIGVCDKKMLNLVEKAYHSTDKFSEKTRFRQYSSAYRKGNWLAREIMGKTFIFVKKVDKIVLVTVLS